MNNIRRSVNRRVEERRCPHESDTTIKINHSTRKKINERPTCFCEFALNNNAKNYFHVVLYIYTYVKFSSRGEGVPRKKRFRVHSSMNVEIPTTRGINFHRNICHRLDDVVADRPTLRSKYRYLDYTQKNILFSPGKSMQNRNGWKKFFKEENTKQNPAKLRPYFAYRD